jgi:glycosyltransferase involved in cell wall biosynthesis
LRILFVNYEYPPLGGGGGVVNAWLAEELGRRHDVTVLTSGAFDLGEREVCGNVEILRIPTFFRRQMAVANVPSMAAFIIGGGRTARKLIRLRDFGVINTHFAIPSGPVGASLARTSHVPNVLSVHGGDLYDPTKWLSPHRHAALRAVVRRIVTAADAVVGQSRNTNANLRRYYGAALEPHLIPLGIPRPGRPTGGRHELGLAPDEFVMITIGRLVARKGTDQLVNLVTRLGKSVRLVVVGDGPELEALRLQVDQLGIASRVTFTGFVPDHRKTDWLAASDIYVSASQHEGFGLVFLEAMAQGLPIVCYQHGGQTDFLTNGVNGALLPLNDLDGLEQAVRHLRSDPAKRCSIAAKNRSDVEQYFIETCAARYEELFFEVAAQGHRLVGMARQ